MVLIRIGGSLDAETAPKFGKKLEAEMDKGALKIVCSMAKLDYIASAGMGVLISVNESLSRRGGAIHLSSMNDKIKKIFKLLGFINIFKIYDNDDQAIDSF